MEPALKRACDKILSFRKEQGGRVLTGGLNATPNENRLANMKRKLSMRCSKTLGAKPSERKLSAKESAYFKWCISDDEQARQGIPPEQGLGGNPPAAAPVDQGAAAGGERLDAAADGDVSPPVVIEVVKRRRIRAKTTSMPGTGYPPPTLPHQPPITLAVAVAAMQRPAAAKPMREQRANECYKGYNNEDCTLSTTNPGHKAWVQPQRGQKHCMFCCEVEFDRQAGDPHTPGGKITIALRRLQGQAQHTRYELAVQRIRNWKGDEVFSDFMARVQRVIDKKDVVHRKVNVPIADR